MKEGNDGRDWRRRKQSHRPTAERSRPFPTVPVLSGLWPLASGL